MSSDHLILCHPLLLCPQSFPASESLPMSQFFTSGGQSIVVSTSTSVLPMNIQDWFPLGWTGLISLLSKGLSRVFSNTTVQKHQYICVYMYIINQYIIWLIWHGLYMTSDTNEVGFPDSSVHKDFACQFRRCRRLGLRPGLGRSPGEGNGNPLLYCCLENPMDKGAWWATVHGVTKSQTRLKWLSTHTCTSEAVAITLGK